MSVWSEIGADVYRLNGREGVISVLKALLFHRTFRAILSARLARGAANKGPWRVTLPFFKLLHRLLSWMAAVDLPWQVEIGPGLAITHGWGVVISPGARIGANVTLFHGATIGRRDRIDPHGTRTIGYPTLEDEVWVGPHAIIIGGITIGRGSRIAGGFCHFRRSSAFCRFGQSGTNCQARLHPGCHASRARHTSLRWGQEQCVVN